jgi:DNA-binding response OmpR family regulator
MAEREKVREGRPGFPTILHVDDDKLAVELVGSFLNRMGYRVISSRSPFLAPLLTGYHPDLLVLDVQMPLLTGDHVLKLMRERQFHAGLKVIFYSAMSEEELRVMAGESAVHGYVSKEQGLPALLTAIRTVLAAG